MGVESWKAVHADAGWWRPDRARDEADARLAGELAVGLGHVGGAAFLAAYDGFDGARVFVQRVDAGQIAFARDQEHARAPWTQLLHQYLAAIARDRRYYRHAGTPWSGRRGADGFRSDRRGVRPSAVARKGQRSGRMLPSSSPVLPQARQDADQVHMHGMARADRVAGEDGGEDALVLGVGDFPHLGVDEVVLHPAEHGAALAQVPQVRHAGGQGGVAAGGGDGAVKARSCWPGMSVSDMPSCAARMAASCAGVACCAASAAHSGSISMRASSRSKGPMSSAPAAARRRRRRAFAGGHEHARADAHFHVAFDFERDQRLADRGAADCSCSASSRSDGRRLPREIARADPAGDLVGDHAVQAGDGNGGRWSWRKKNAANLGQVVRPVNIDLKIQIKKIY